jgi:hypothetical protein
MRLVSFILFSAIALASSAPSAFAAENAFGRASLSSATCPVNEGYPECHADGSVPFRQLLNSSPSSRSVRAGEDTGPKQIFCCPRHHRRSGIWWRSCGPFSPAARQWTAYSSRRRLSRYLNGQRLACPPDDVKPQVDTPMEPEVDTSIKEKPNG